MTYRYDGIVVDLYCCTEEDNYKLGFLRRNLQSREFTMEDLFHWLHVQDIYFRIRYEYNRCLSICTNINSYIKYLKAHRSYRATGKAKQKHDSNDLIVREVISLLDDTSYSVYKI